MLENLTHRGAVGADPLMGDGAGILVQIPDRFFREEMAKQGVTLPKAGEYAVGYLFMSDPPAFPGEGRGRFWAWTAVDAGTPPRRPRKLPAQSRLFRRENR